MPVQIEVDADGSVVDDGTDLESISEVLRLVPIGEGDDMDAAAAVAARAQEKSDEELARMIQVRFRYDMPGCIGWSSAVSNWSRSWSCLVCKLIW